MTRHQTFKLAAVAAAAISAGGVWGIVHAQTSPGAQPARAEVGSFAIPATGSGIRPVPNGQNYPYYFTGPGGANNWSYVAAPENDPEMAKLAEAEMELAHNADEFLTQYVAADKPDDQKRLKAELRDMLTKQFDVQKQRRELELSRIEERIKKLRDQIKKRNDARETIIDRRLEQLTNEAEGLGWGQPAGAGAVPQPLLNYRTNSKR
jgi:hypothetical protein